VRGWSVNTVLRDWPRWCGGGSRWVIPWPRPHRDQRAVGGDHRPMAASLAEHVVECDGLEIAAADDVEQLGKQWVIVGRLA
jgi:hypothetical protein